MAANLFSRLERFREESQVMAAHWSIAQIENGESLTHSRGYRAVRAAKNTEMIGFVVYFNRECNFLRIDKRVSDFDRR